MEFKKEKEESSILSKIKRERERQCPNSRPTIFLVYLKSTIFLFRVPRTLVLSTISRLQISLLFFPAREWETNWWICAVNRVHPRKCWREKMKKEENVRSLGFLFVLRSTSRANINLSIREEEEGCVRIWFSRCQCRALILGIESASISSLSLSLSFETRSSNRETLFTDIAKYFPPSMVIPDLVSGSGVTRDGRKRKVEEKNSKKRIDYSFGSGFRPTNSFSSFFFFFILDRFRALSFEMIES